MVKRIRGVKFRLLAVFAPIEYRSNRIGQSWVVAMPLNNNPIENISEADLTALITNGEGKGIDLEYKQQAYGPKDADKRELLADVSSFANSEGGHLVIGMKETKGIASALPGLDSSSIDDEKQRIEQILNSGLQPRLYRFEMRDVPLASGKTVLVLRIPRSINPPHRTIAYNSNKFYCRNSAGKYEPNVDQLRQLFQRLPSLAQKIRDFRSQRLQAIISGNASLRMMGNGELVLHIVPFEAFELGRQIDVRSLGDNFADFPPMRHDGSMDYRFNLDGFLVHLTPNEHGFYTSYVQLFKSGSIEALRSNIIRERHNDPERIVYSAGVEMDLIVGIIAYLKAYQSLGIEPPYVISVAMLDVLNVRLDREDSWPDSPPIFDRSQLLFSEVIVEQMPASDSEVPKLLRSIFDEIFQASGQSSCPRFDVSGNYVFPKR